MQVTVPHECIENGFEDIKPKAGQDRSQAPPVGTAHQASRAADNHGHAHRPLKTRCRYPEGFAMIRAFPVASQAQFRH